MVPAQAQRTGVNVNVGGSNRRVEVFRAYAQGLSAVEGIMQAANEGLVVASNLTIDAVLSGDGRRSIPELFPCWIGTMTGYTKAGAKLGKEVVHTDSQTGERWIFPVPEQFREERNSLLVMEHPDYALVRDGKDILVEPTDIARVSLVSQFPESSNGWYLVDPQHGIPTGSQADSQNPVSRYLWRLAEGRVGAVARGNSILCNSRRLVNLYNQPSVGFGVAVETPAEQGPPKIEVPAVTREMVERGNAELDVLRSKGVTPADIQGISDLMASLNSALGLKG